MSPSLVCNWTALKLIFVCWILYNTTCKININGKLDMLFSLHFDKGCNLCHCFLSVCLSVCKLFLYTFYRQEILVFGHFHIFLSISEYPDLGGFLTDDKLLAESWSAQFWNFFCTNCPWTYLNMRNIIIKDKKKMNFLNNFITDMSSAAITVCMWSTVWILVQISKIFKNRCFPIFVYFVFRVKLHISSDSL